MESEFSADKASFYYDFTTESGFIDVGVLHL
jgi:hypothetical protein